MLALHPVPVAPGKAPALSVLSLWPSGGKLVRLENKKVFSSFYIGGFMHKRCFEKREKLEVTVGKAWGHCSMESSASTWTCLGGCLVQGTSTK